MNISRFKYFLFSLLALFLFSPLLSFGQAQNQTAQLTTFSFSPQQQTVQEGSTFDVSVYINTHNKDINTINLKMLFDPRKLALVRPSSGQSLISIWVEPLSYSNTDGTVNMSGVIQNGLNTQSGLITTITFKALIPGTTVVNIDPSSTVLANDGLGTETQSEFGQGTYTIVQAPPAGVRVFSDTHQFESQWYNNKNPIIGWDKDLGANGFSFVLDDKPATIPENTITATDTTMSYQNLNDGIWYFHIKEEKNNVWGATTNFTIRTDTIPPEPFQPTADIVQDSKDTRALIHFATTDSLSGIDHYEVAVINKNESPNISPVFVQAGSPYQLSIPPATTFQVIVRAVDAAGNVRDETLDVYVPLPFISFVMNHSLSLLLILIALLFAFILFHFLSQHKIAARTKEVFYLLEHGEEMEQVEKEIHEKESEKTLLSDTQ